MCANLGVSRAAYYAWSVRSPSAQQQTREMLLVVIRLIHDEFKQRYGSPRMHAALQSRGYMCSLNTVAEQMRANGLTARGRRKYRCTTDSNHPLPVAENLLDRQFEPGAINRNWVADITYIATHEGWLYLAAVEDLGSRMIVGWSMSETMTSRLVVDAWEMAWERRHPGEGLLTHSDRGSQYASEHYQQRLSEKGIRCSMSRRGNCWDNAAMESFFATLKKELVHDERYATRAEAKASIFEYIEVFYNRIRLHSSLGYRSPSEYEQSL